MNTDYYLISREWPYKNVERFILAEEYVEDKITHDARDYKFFCFDGQVKCFKVDFDRHTDHHANWYDREGKILPYGEKICPPRFEREIILPNELPKMIELAETLSHKIPFLRVDFYYINERVLFSELTFYPASGLLPFTDAAWDTKMGGWIYLPE